LCIFTQASVFADGVRVKFSVFPAFLRPFGLKCPGGGTAGGFRPSSHDFLPHQIKIRQPNQCKHLSRVLHDPFITRLPATKLALDDPKQVLHPRPD
jgi:hypothetical protein